MAVADTVKLAVRALLEVVEAGSKNVEIAVLTCSGGMEVLSDEAVDKIVMQIDEEKAMETAKPVRSSHAAAIVVE